MKCICAPFLLAIFILTRHPSQDFCIVFLRSSDFTRNFVKIPFIYRALLSYFHLNLSTLPLSSLLYEHFYECGVGCICIFPPLADLYTFVLSCKNWLNISSSRFIGVYARIYWTATILYLSHMRIWSAGIHLFANPINNMLLFLLNLSLHKQNPLYDRRNFRWYFQWDYTSFNSSIQLP